MTEVFEITGDLQKDISNLLILASTAQESEWEDILSYAAQLGFAYTRTGVSISEIISVLEEEANRSNANLNAMQVLEQLLESILTGAFA